MDTSLTIDHEEIRLWAKAHSGRPEIVVDPGTAGVDPILRLNFPGQRDDIFLGENLGEERVTWKEFFDLFDRLDLAFEYEREIRGEASSAYRFVKREQRR